MRNLSTPLNPVLVADLMLATIETKGLGAVNIDGPAFRAAAKELGVKHTRRDLGDYLGGGEYRTR